MPTGFWSVRRTALTAGAAAAAALPASVALTVTVRRRPSTTPPPRGGCAGLLCMRQPQADVSLCRRHRHPSPHAMVSDTTPTRLRQLAARRAEDDGVTCPTLARTSDASHPPLPKARIHSLWISIAHAGGRAPGKSPSGWMEGGSHPPWLGRNVGDAAARIERREDVATAGSSTPTPGPRKRPTHAIKSCGSRAFSFTSGDSPFVPDCSTG